METICAYGGTKYQRGRSKFSRGIGRTVRLGPEPLQTKGDSGQIKDLIQVELIQENLDYPWDPRVKEGASENKLTRPMGWILSRVSVL